MPSRTRLFFEAQRESKRESELWEALISVVGHQSLGQPREVETDNSFEQLPDVNCRGVIFANLTGKEIAVRRGNAGTVFYRIPDGMGQVIDVVDNADELYVKNNEDGTTVTVGISLVLEHTE